MSMCMPSGPVTCSAVMIGGGPGSESGAGGGSLRSVGGSSHNGSMGWYMSVVMGAQRKPHVRHDANRGAVHCGYVDNPHCAPARMWTRRWIRRRPGGPAVS